MYEVDGVVVFVESFELDGFEDVVVEMVCVFGEVVCFGFLVVEVEVDDFVGWFDCFDVVVVDECDVVCEV